MMDNALIQLIARLKIRLRQEKGVSINTQKFFSDVGYASQTLDIAEECEDVELVTLAMDIRDKLGWISLPSAQPVTVTAPAPLATKSPVKAEQEKRYVFGARC
ncbi:hypothetical protein VVD49_12835 [Uliginosibacterium sp. H3]|uniref:XRE family transcriptional regulator n=1 Tax=Uliginosibacterium silvisoli TaxID=3114758 RepID=A0ABU6K4R6_9RHOO|nr:hypothetical protein [Uliginosibacterium sp. H3]